MLSDKTKVYRLTIILILCLGVSFRIYHYIDNRSLWIDEIYLSTSLIKMDFSQLATQQLDFEQKAPLGYLWMSRVAVELFGTKEIALRLFTFLCGLVSLFVFIPVSRYFLSPLGTIVSLGILAFAPPLIYHGVEAKQYGCELLVTILAYYLYIRYYRTSSYSSMLKWGLLGAMLLWFSFSAVLVLGGIAIGTGVMYISKKEWKRLFRVMIPFLIWLLSFVIEYVFFVKRHTESAWLIIWFKQHANPFMPLIPTTLKELQWLPYNLYLTLQYPLGLLLPATDMDNSLLRVLARMPILPILFFAAGIYCFFKKNVRALLIISTPIILTLLASAIEKYPFFERLLVFMAPLLIIIVAKGCESIANLSQKRWLKFSFPAILLAVPLLTSAGQAINPDHFYKTKKSYHRETISYIHDRYRAGDMVYIYWNHVPGFDFYKKTYGMKFHELKGSDVRKRSRNWEEYFQNLNHDFERIAGKKRVWVIYQTFIVGKIGEPLFPEGLDWYYKTDKPMRRLHHELNKRGKQLDAYKTSDIEVYLFDMTNNK